jgi:4'-phosphopantetheinyl transferase
VKRAPAPVLPQAPQESAGGTQRAQGWIDLWHANLQHTGWRRLLHLLSDEEHRRAGAFAFDRDARRFIVSRAVLRTLLSGVTGVPACELKLRIEQEGKPVLEPGMGRPVHFSLSRSEELVLIGLAPRPLGVDVEWLDKAMDVEALANYVLSRHEQESFKRLDARDRRKAFLQCWTIKEAYLKAIGKGLLVPTAMVEVSFRPGERVGLQSIFGDVRATSRWFVDLIVPRQGYIGAVATRGGPWRTRVQAFDLCSLIP